MSHYIECVIKISGDKKELLRLRLKIVNNRILESLCPPSPSSNRVTSIKRVVYLLGKKEIPTSERFELNKTLWGTYWEDRRTKLIRRRSDQLIFVTHFHDNPPFLALEHISQEYPNLVLSIIHILNEYTYTTGRFSWRNGILIEDSIKVHDVDDLPRREANTLEKIKYKSRIFFWRSLWFLQNPFHRRWWVKNYQEEIPF
jgi:hypothetical protein